MKFLNIMVDLAITSAKYTPIMNTNGKNMLGADLKCNQTTTC